MNTFELNHPNELLEPDEPEGWEIYDFEDILPTVEPSQLVNEITWNCNLEWHEG